MTSEEDRRRWLNSEKEIESEADRYREEEDVIAGEVPVELVEALVKPSGKVVSSPSI